MIFHFKVFFLPNSIFFSCWRHVEVFQSQRTGSNLQFWLHLDSLYSLSIPEQGRSSNIAVALLYCSPNPPNSWFAPDKTSEGRTEGHQSPRLHICPQLRIDLCAKIHIMPSTKQFRIQSYQLFHCYQTMNLIHPFLTLILSKLKMYLIIFILSTKMYLPHSIKIRMFGPKSAVFAYFVTIIGLGDHSVPCVLMSFMQKKGLNL